MSAKDLLSVSSAAVCILVMASAMTAVIRGVPQSGKAQPKVSDESGARAERARELIRLSRRALGGEENLNKVQTLSTSAKIRRFVKYVMVESPSKVTEKEKTLSGKIQIDIQLPDKFRQRVSRETLRGFGYSYLEIVNGDRAWRDPPLRAISSNQSRQVIDVGDFERTVELQARGARQQQTLYWLGFLLQEAPHFPLKFSYTGQLKTRVGEANVIEATGPDNFLIFILLDPKNNLPLALDFPFFEVRGPLVAIAPTAFLDRRSMRKIAERANLERNKRIKGAERYEMYLKLSEYRPVAGLLWPTRITTTINDEIAEELIFGDFEVNRSLSPKKFEGEPKFKY